ncbi:hypothetical protein [Tritonibacter sp. AK171]|uniref:hypothetical protein n=1 Tax=Tritonibacter sp. AK171 TaxID=3048493 RepID=UPI0024C25C80|nr:hypothetical protein [Tritonibacter sp. AK171]
MKPFGPSIAAIVAASFLPSMAVATEMGVLASDDCILTAGRDVKPSAGFVVPVAFIDITRETQKPENKIDPLGAAIGAKLVEFAFDAGVNYLSKKANPEPEKAQDILPINLFRVENDMPVSVPAKTKKTADKEDTQPLETKTVRPVFLNPALNCLTIVTASAPVLTENGLVSTADLIKAIKDDGNSLDPWSREAEINGLKDETVNYRLAKAGLSVFDGGEIGSILELRLELSADGSAFRYVPVYFDVRRFATSGTQDRDIAFTVKLSTPAQSGDENIALASFHATNVKRTDSGGVQRVSVQDSKDYLGFGPMTAAAVLGGHAWSQFTMPMSDPPENIEKLLNLSLTTEDKPREVLSDFADVVQRLQTTPFTYKAMNISVSFEESTEPSKIVAFLNDFVEDNDGLQDKLEKATIKALGLQSDADALAEIVAIKQREIDAAKAHLAVFKADPSHLLPAKKDWFDKQVADREKQIAKMEAELAALKFGEDPYAPTQGLDNPEPEIEG